MIKTATRILLLLLCLIAWQSRADNAPIVQAGIILNAPATPSVTTVPVTVRSFLSIGSFTLSLDYDSTIAQYTGFSPNGAFPGMTVGVTTPGGTTKRLTINWPAGGQGITLPDESALLNLSFKYKVSGSKTFLNWYDNGTSCQFTKYSSGSYTVLTDSPAASFYLNGVITNHAAPYTTAPTITSATPGLVAVPITVTNCYNIGSVSLVMEYNPDVLTYQSFTQNGSILGAFSVGSNTHPVTGVTTMNLGWYGPAFLLADGSTMLTLYFTYSNSGSSNYSELNFQTDLGAACDYSDGQFRLLYDDQTSVFLTNGLVTGQLAPRTWLPSFTDATPSGHLVSPVKVSNFSDIKSFRLAFKYDPNVITFDSSSANAAFNGQLSVINYPVGGDGTRTIRLIWNGSSALSLSDQSALATLHFTYNTGTTTLAWITGNDTSCRFNDASGNRYYDKPKPTYYRDGLAASHVAPRTAVSYASPSPGQSFTLPVLVFGYSNIGLFNLTLDYDPGVLSYQGANLVPSLGGTFSATSPGPGRIVLNWTGTATTLNDSSTLINLSFNYVGGESALVFYDDGNSCRYAESAVSSTLYDQPKNTYYVSGYVGSNPLVANFTANNTMPLVNETVTFSDLSTGNPTSWNWIFSPSDVDYMSGTTPNSKNPQVRFTKNGVYTVTLIEYRGSAGGIKVRSQYIFVGIPGLWTGLTSSSWYTSSNWHNYRIPDGTINVVIPASAPHWPVFTGNFTLGTQCQSLKLTGGGSCTMTVQPLP